MAMPAPWPAAEEILDLAVDTLGMHVLWHLADEGADRKSRGRQDFIVARVMQVHQSRRDPQRGMSATHSSEAVRAEPQIARALSEAWEWLVAEQLIAVDAVAIALSEQAGTDPYFVTRWGMEVAAEGSKGLDLTRAKRRLGLELHSDLAEPLRKLIQVGAFEQAAFTALREIEQRVRTMAGEPKGKSGGTLRGEPLMTETFKPGGVLADAEAETAEQQGQMNLFKGAFAAFRNPLGHTSIEFDDPIEAAEVVLLADLLMRQLDHVSNRLQAAATSSSASPA
jgi:uncharacterized protein (TIGR02391 family)